MGNQIRTFIILCYRVAIIAIEDRASLDRRRFEDAHLKFAILQISAWYPELMHSKNVPLTPDISKVLEKFTSAYYRHFTTKYAGNMPSCIYQCTAYAHHIMPISSMSAGLNYSPFAFI